VVDLYVYILKAGS